MRICIKAWMSLNFSQIRPLSTELPALERLKYRCFHFFLVAIDPDLFKLAGVENVHKIWRGLIFRMIKSLTMELAALECLKVSKRLMMGK